jgi:hypothetical protein
MAKRFIDTGIFDDDWFMDLPKDAKLLWIYFITKCNHAGMIKINEKLCKLQTDIRDLSSVIIQLDNRLVTVSEHLYFIPKFIEFQYPGFPNSKAKAQQSAIDILVKYDLFDREKLTLTEQLPNCYNKSNGNNNDSFNSNDEKLKPEKKCFIPPTMDEVKIFFNEKGYNEIGAIKAFEHYNLAGWHDTEGKPVLNWKQKMNTNWLRQEYLINKQEIIKPFDKYLKAK